MKTKPLFSAVLMALLYGCGGGGGGNSAAEQPAPSASDGATVRDSTMLTGIRFAPTRGERPDAQTQAQIDIAVAETNRLRAEAGRSPLAVDQSLAAYAAARARESASRFAHNRDRPDSQVAGDYSLFNRGRASVIGENLQKGIQDPRNAIEHLRQSSGHYRNMIEAGYGKIGIGYYRTGTETGHYWAQIFTDPNTTSKFRFITPLSREEALQAIRSAARYQGGVLTLELPPDEKQALGEGILAAPYSSTVKTDHRLILRPYRNAGWSYQTFGEIIDDEGIPEAYVNIGRAYVPAENAALSATYRGKMVGDLGQHSRVIADVHAVLDYGAGGKTLTVSMTGSRRGTRDLERGQPTAFTVAPDLNFSDTLTWNPQTQSFNGEGHSARLYGTDGEELGGQFAREANAEIYRGAYGAGRVPQP